MAKLFGTDGVRGIIGRDMNGDFAFKLAFAAGQVLRAADARGAVLIGRDTRSSGALLEEAVAAGLGAAGMEVWLAGVMTTPGVAFLTPALGASAGVVISASHNPHYYNGIKILSRNGSKLPDEESEEIERVFDSLPDSISQCTRRNGHGTSVSHVIQRYSDFLVAFSEEKLTGLTLVLDCAHGAASAMALEIFQAAGATVRCIGASPDGRNINFQCGSLYPESLQQAVVETNASAGLAFDGDADRVVLVDEHGSVLDGDHILAIMAREMKESQRLPYGRVVGTTMSGLGLEISLREAGCHLLRSEVGDRYVFEMMEQEGANLGGEPSGHVIFKDRAITGDGMLTGIAVLKVMAEHSRRLSDLASLMRPVPQVTLSIPLNDHRSWQKDPSIVSFIHELEATLGDEGRMVVRASGTEPVVRILVEGLDKELISSTAQRVAAMLTSRYGA